MKLAEVFRFEVAYRVRQPSTWVYAGALLGLPLLMLNAVDGGPTRANAPETVATFTIVVGMLGMLVTAALFGDAATRDVGSGMHPLFYTAPIGRTDYLGGRFLGALVVNAVLVLGVPLGLLAGTAMPYLDPEMFGPVRAAAYVQPYLLFMLPNLFLSAAILFAVGVLARGTLVTYVAGIGLFVGYVFGTELLDRLENRTLAALLDPFGAAALDDLTRYWTAVERNTRLIGFPEVLVWNRLIWLAVAAGVLLLLYRRFRFEHPAAGARRREERRAAPPRPGDAAPAREAPVAAPSVPTTFGWRTRVRQTLAVAGHSARELLTNRLFLLILAGLVLVVFVYGWRVGDAVFGTSSWPVTHLVAGRAVAVPGVMFLPVLIALFAGELVWRERDVGVSEIADAAPVPGWVPLLGRFLALVGLLVAIQAVLMAAGVTIQALKGYHDFELGLYLQIVFGLTLADYVLFAVVALAVHTIVNHKYVGHLVVILYYVFSANAARFGVHHGLLVHFGEPDWVYSDMSGFGPHLRPWLWFELYWAAWVLLLAVVASLFRVRGTERGLRFRIERARVRLTRPVLGAAGVAAVLILTLGGFVFYNTNVLNEYRTPFEARELRAEYERRYARHEDAPQPRITAADLRIEIHPAERAADLRGEYRLVNATARPIDSVHVSVHREIDVHSLVLDRTAERVLDDDELQYRIYELERGLEPGDSLRLSFDLAFRPRGFRNSGQPTAVVRNGAYFDRSWLPIIGYQPALELSNDRWRRDHGLEPRPPLPEPDDPRARRERFDFRDADLVAVETVIGTDEDQIAVTTGGLVEEWRERGRRWFRYRTDGPERFAVPILSARYEVLEDRWKDVGLRIFHHPTHTFNLERMVRAMKASLDYFTTHFGPYPYDRLRIVEFPRYASFARAHPHTIAYSEGSAFLTRVREDDVDRPFFVTAHETAHQWWGGQLTGAQVRGKALLSETLAQYGAMRVMEETYGPEQVRRFYDYEMDRYLRGRRVYSNRETPLLDVEDQSYVYYHKGAVAMYTLREHIGADSVDAALRRFLETHRDAGPPFPTSRDLYRELRSATPDSLRYLLRDLFEEITLWDVRTERASVEPTGGGEYRVTLDVLAKKVRADSLGNETEVPMNDLVEVGVFASGGDAGEPLYLERQRIRSGRQTITVTVPGEPGRAGIDPHRKLIQRDGGDNVVRVERRRRTADAAQLARTPSSRRAGSRTSF